MHRLLARQIKKFLKQDEMLPLIQPLLDAVDAAYQQFDEDRRLLERSVNLAGQELIERNRDLRARLDQQKRAENELTHIVSMLQCTLETLTEGVLIIDLDGKPIFFNEKILGLWELSQEDMHRMTANIIYDTIEQQLIYPDYFKMQRVRMDYLNEKFCMIHERLDNRVFEFEGVFNEDIGYIWCFRDITDKFRQEEKLVHLAHHDALTSLPNRILLMDRIKHAIDKARRHKVEVAILFFDLDRFKQINDSFGHDIGDQLLVQVAQRIKHVIREEDTLARIGGDEFVILLESVKLKDNINTCLDKILDIFKTPFKLQSQELVMSTSIGVAVYPDDGDNSGVLLKKADIAMYQAKRDGRNRAHYFMPEMELNSTKAFSMENKIRQAIKEKAFEIHYQPKFRLSDGKLLGYEALLRWPTPNGYIPPDAFIPIAEHTGLIIELGKWAIEQVCQQILQVKKLGYEDLIFSINFSAKQFECHDIFETVVKNLSKHNIDASELAIEITETMILAKFDQAIDLMRQFKKLGVKIFLDDFGTGYSSLSYLKALPLDAIKIDKTFMTDLVHSRQDQAIIETIIALGHTLNLEIIAEGIENFEQLSLLHSIKCDIAQGYLLGKPAPMLPHLPDNPDKLVEKSDILPPAAND